MTKFKNGLLDYFMFFGSMSTLICCVLPSLLVSLGLGAVMAGLASNVPGLVWISEHKSKCSAINFLKGEKMKTILFVLLAGIFGTSVFAKGVNTTKKITMEVTEKGFVPSEINVTPELAKGEIRFGCGMNMVEGGKIISR